MSATSTRGIKKRIQSAKNIKQITKALEMVSASKMRRAQEKALTTRPYSTKIHEILKQLVGKVEREKHPLLHSSDEKQGSIAVVLISSDRGLCGALNSNLFRALEDFKTNLGTQRPEEILSFEFISIGRKSREYILKTGQSLHAEFTNFPEKPDFEDILPISRLAIEGFTSDKFKEIYLVYTAFISTLKQEVENYKLLPIEPKQIKSITQEETGPQFERRNYIFEPSVGRVIDSLLPHYIEIEIYQTILEAFASEHSARMVAMRNASDNATEVIDDLTLIYNKKRQQSITNEISDLVTSRLAVASQ